MSGQKTGHLQRVEDVLSVAAKFEDAEPRHEREMFADRRPVEREIVGDLTCAELVLFQHLRDCDANRVREPFQDFGLAFVFSRVRLFCQSRPPLMW